MPFALVLVEFEGWLCLAAGTGGGFLAEMEGDDDCCEGAPFVCTIGGGRLILGGAGGGTAVTTTGAMAAAAQQTAEGSEWIFSKRPLEPRGCLVYRADRDDESIGRSAVRLFVRWQQEERDRVVGYECVRRCENDGRVYGPQKDTEEETWAMMRNRIWRRKRAVTRSRWGMPAMGAIEGGWSRSHIDGFRFGQPGFKFNGKGGRMRVPRANLRGVGKKVNTGLYSLQSLKEVIIRRRPSPQVSEPHRDRRAGSPLLWGQGCRRRANRMLSNESLSPVWVQCWVSL